jgi:transcriptional regulator with XRE-family HTH domain
MIITGAQVKAARQLLGWTQSRLAGEVVVSASNIAKLKGGDRAISVLTVSTTRRVLTEACIELRASRASNSGNPNDYHRRTAQGRPPASRLVAG